MQIYINNSKCVQSILNTRIKRCTCLIENKEGQLFLEKPVSFQKPIKLPLINKISSEGTIL